MDSFKKEVRRGHNIVADGWAGASNLHPHPKPQTLLHIHKHNKYPKRSFFHFSTRSPLHNYGRIDGRTKPLIELHICN